MAFLDTNVTGSFVEDRDSAVSIGIDLPFHRDIGPNGWFATTKTTIEAVKNNIINLLHTNRGEIVFQPNLGLGRRQFLFEQITPDTIIAIQNDIRDTLSLWLPFVIIENIIVNQKDDFNRIDVKLEFRINQVPNSLDSITVGIT